MTTDRPAEGFVPGRHLLDAYGNGGFRFAEMSHRGSNLVLRSVIRGWDVREPSGLTAEAFAPVLAEADAIELLLIGTGLDLVPLRPPVRQRLRDAGLGIDVMQTGAAARTYNVLVAENRRVAAALVAVA